MTAIRKTLPNRRESKSFSFECNGLNYTATIGRDDEGHLAEVFINNSKFNSMSDMYARDSGILCSLSLQYGVPLKTIVSALGCDSNGEPV